MYIVDDGIKLDYVIERPDVQKDRYPMVIIIHGITGNKDERHLVALSKMFNENGFAALRIDMYGHGKSEGEFKDHTYHKWMSNAMKIIDHVRGLDYVSDIYLCGHSQGGVTVMLAAALKHEFIKGLIALSPSAMRPELARKGTFFGVDFDPDNIPEEFKLWEDKTLSGNYIRISQMIHVEEAIDRYKGPVLVVVGTKDSPELVESTRISAQRYNDATYVQIHDETHCYENRLDDMVSTVRDWIQEQEI